MADSTDSSGTRTTNLIGNLLTAIGVILLVVSTWVTAFAPYRPTLTIVGIILITLALAMTILGALRKR